MTRVSPTLHAEIPEGKLEMHPEDGSRLGVGEGEKVKVTSRRGEITVKVTVTDRVDVGVVFMPFHFAETCANVLTNPAHDPTAKIPEYKVCAVKVEKAA
jgi:predicted molibdopterin-dependent oxidoreductase YjgC